MYFLGIDGGGTKTNGVITDESGVIIAESIVGASNPNNVAPDRLEAVFKHLFTDLERKSGININNVQHVFAGLSGVDRPADKTKMRKFFSTFLDGSVNISVENDAVTALYSGTLGAPGIVQISGTGSITYGINERNERDRVGGWGHLINEKGSGFSIGRDGLATVFQSHDGLSEDTVLHKSMLDYFQVDSIPEVIQPVYHADNVKEGIAALSRLVFDATDEGDGVAESIIDYHGRKLGEMIVCLMEKLFKEEHIAVPVVLAGGIFNRLDLFWKTIEAAITSKGRKAILTIPDVVPVAGAVVAAMNKERVPIDKTSFIENYNHSRGG